MLKKQIKKVRKMIKTNCFGYDEKNNRCTVLTTLLCKRTNCGFNKEKGTECKKCLYEHIPKAPQCKSCRWHKNKEVTVLNEKV